MKNALVVYEKSPERKEFPILLWADEYLKGMGYEPVYMDLGEGLEGDLYRYHMEQVKPEFLITLDLAGYSIELLGGDLFYNSLCCPALHILLKHPEEYGERLQARVNFNMTYLTTEAEDLSILKSIPRVTECDCLEFPGALREEHRPIELFLPGNATDSLTFRLAQGLSEDGIPLCVAGKGWMEHPLENVQALGEDGVNLEQLWPVLQNTQVILDATTDWKMGRPEWRFMAAMAGCTHLPLQKIHLPALYEKLSQILN